MPDNDCQMPDLEHIGLDTSVGQDSVETMDLVCRSRIEASSSEALQSTLRGNFKIFFLFYFEISISIIFIDLYNGK